jgi:N-acetylmuramoyl-L-alanine amidase|tara:strand:- start:44 stop:580 length:537 start_codon:yes stop_codon:yes gene_type:complete
MKIAFVVGHHKKSKGAWSPFAGYSEWDFYNEVVKHLGDVNVFWHDENISGYTSRIQNTADKINKVDFDLVIELHFNSSDNNKANGCETLYYHKSSKGRIYADMFSELIVSQTGIKSRNGGLKPLKSKQDRGFASVYYTNAPTILIEPFFGSNKSDCDKIKSSRNLASIIQMYIDNIKQ